MSFRPIWIYAGRMIHIVDAVDGGCTLAVITKLMGDLPDQKVEDQESTTMFYTAFPWHGGSTDTVHRGQGRLVDPNWHVAESCTYELMKALLR